MSVDPAARVNGMLKQGARRERIQAKLFGGARTIRNLSDVGATNGASPRSS